MKTSSRREFLKTTGTMAAASSLAGVAFPAVHPGEDNTLQLALVGAGGRGTGAAENALSVSQALGPVKLVAMADVFEDKLAGSYKNLSEKMKDKVDVPPERRFIGFDGYKKAMDQLKKGDIVICTTPPAFRWLFFKHAVEKGLNVFMEKPVTVDGPSTRKVLAINEEAKKKNLKVAVGLMCRHCTAREELAKRIRDGQIGQILLMRAYRMHGPIGSCRCKVNDGKISDLLYQIRNFHSFLWLSGGNYSDFLIHNIDECCMMKDAWPVKARASGGRHFRGDYIDQNFDSYAIEYTFADGTTLEMNGRTIARCQEVFASYAHGTKGSAVISTRAHTPAYCRIYKGQNIHEEQYKGDDLAWAAPQPEPNPYQTEWDRFIADIRQDKPHNEADRGAMASLVTSMGRMAAHTGKVVTLEEAMASDHEFAPNLETLTMDGPSPLMPDDNGKYPVPAPGEKGNREY